MKNPKKGKPLLFEKPEDLQKKIDKYFAYCKKNKKPYTMGGMACYLDCSRQTLIDYENRDKFTEIVRRARSKVEAYVEEQLFTGKGVAGVIFNLKNNFGWRDQIDIDAKTENKHHFPELTKKEADNLKKAFNEDF